MAKKDEKTNIDGKSNFRNSVMLVAALATIAVAFITFRKEFLPSETKTISHMDVENIHIQLSRSNGDSNYVADPFFPKSENPVLEEITENQAKKSTSTKEIIFKAEKKTLVRAKLSLYSKPFSGATIIYNNKVVDTTDITGRLSFYVPHSLGQKKYEVDFVKGQMSGSINASAVGETTEKVDAIINITNK